MFETKEEEEKNNKEKKKEKMRICKGINYIFYNPVSVNRGVPQLVTNYEWHHYYLTFVVAELENRRR